VTLVVDASVAAKWVLEEDGSDRANALRAEGGLIAPSLVAAEIGNTLWKAVHRGLVSRADALVAVEAALLPFDALMANEELLARALEMAMDLSHPIYDCFYLALAERERAPIISADAKLLSAAKKMKGVEGRKL
jgi:predicted nucleic acid-binding protein